MVLMGLGLVLVPGLVLVLVLVPELVPELVVPEEPVVPAAPEALVVQAWVAVPEAQVVLAAQAEPGVLGATEPEATTTTAR